MNGPAVTVDPLTQRTPCLQPVGWVSGYARQTVPFYISFLLSGSEPACAPPEVTAAPALARLNIYTPIPPEARAKRGIDPLPLR